MRRSRTAIITIVCALVLSFAAAYASAKLWRRYQNRFRPVPGAAAMAEGLHLKVGETPPLPAAMSVTNVPGVRVSEIARDLRVVWSLRLAADGRLFIVERPGRILVLESGADRPVTYASLPTALDGESGLMGLALHPQFPRKPYVYVMYTARKSGGGVNRIARLTDVSGLGRDERVLIDDIGAARNHDGGALEFGPDGMLYVGTGDALSERLAQDISKPNGKILRITADGGVPSDNPWPGSPVWAYGFRNVTALAFHPRTRELWAASHGPSGVAGDEHKYMDSVYLVRKGGNHGWPDHLGMSTDPSIVSPVIFFRDRAAPPGGMIFYTGPTEAFRDNLFMTSLRGEELLRFVIEDGREVTRIERWWPGRYGRLRAIAASPNGDLLIGTSNRDGRTSTNYPSSDVILRVRFDADR
jgi:quinoprotein glucose dehydrogenase